MYIDWMRRNHTLFVVLWRESVCVFGREREILTKYIDWITRNHTLSVGGKRKKASLCERKRDIEKIERRIQTKRNRKKDREMIERKREYK